MSSTGSGNLEFEHYSGVEPTVPRRRPLKPSEEPRPYSCDHCVRTFDRPSALEQVSHWYRQVRFDPFPV